MYRPVEKQNSLCLQAASIAGIAVRPRPKAFHIPARHNLFDESFRQGDEEGKGRRSLI
ncbi:MAG: hypothetical protein LBR26_04190 [Prevotella sp.]|nr:hypothetical protein [Prevotella sp.]